MKRKIINPYRMFVGSYLPNWIKQRPIKEISQGAKLAYAQLCQFAGADGNAFPSIEKLAQEIGVSSRQVDRYIRELVSNNLIEAKKRGYSKTNTYAFLDHSWMHEVDKSVDKCPSNPDHRRGSDKSDVSSTTNMAPIKMSDLSPIRESVKRIRYNTQLSNPSDSTIVNNLNSGDKRVDKVFNFWRSLHGIKRKMNATDKRFIERAFNLGYSEKQCLDVLKAHKMCKWHMGENEYGKVFNYLKCIFKDRKKIEQFLEHPDGKKPNSYTLPLEKAIKACVDPHVSSNHVIYMRKRIEQEFPGGMFSFKRQSSRSNMSFFKGIYTQICQELNTSTMVLS